MRALVLVLLGTAWACSNDGGRADSGGAVDPDVVEDSNVVPETGDEEDTTGEPGDESTADVTDEDIEAPPDILAPFFLREVPPLGDLTVVALATESFERRVLAASPAGPTPPTRFPRRTRGCASG